jgi:LysR family hydrogen peroxide-inducible transcriptional activator
VALSDTLHFGRAAERCAISQPALSAQIAQLEEILGVLLVERTKRRVLLTPVGREVTGRAKGILRDVDEISDVASHAQRPLSGTLRIGILPTLGPYLLRHILPTLRSRHPDLKLYLREEPKHRLMRELDLGDLDLVVVSLPEEDEHFTTTPLFFEPFWLTLPLDHRLTEGEILPDSIIGERLLMLEEGHCLRDQALGFCRAHGAAEQTAFRATSLDSLRQMVATGLGATLLPALYVAAEALADDQIAVRPFGADAPGREIGLIWRRTTSRADEFRLFSRLLRAHLPEVVTVIG